jgi:hypothetical protein
MFARLKGPEVFIVFGNSASFLATATASSIERSCIVLVVLVVVITAKLLAIQARGKLISGNQLCSGPARTTWRDCSS